MTGKHIVIWTVVILAVGGLMVGLAYLGTKQNAPVEAKLAVPVGEGDLTAGPSDAKATLVEYGDFQCPACAQYFPIVERLASEYADRLQLVFRHYPIRNIHANAQGAAQAAQAAAAQGKFWEYYRILYTKQADWAKLSDPNEVFNSYAREVNLDMAKFEADRTSGATLSKIQGDIDGGNDSGVSGTPTFYLNGKRIDPAGNYDKFKKLIDDASR